MSEQKIMKLFHGITNISDDIIQEAQEARPSRMTSPWVRWGMAAACACLIVVGVLSGVPLGSQASGETAETTGEDLMPFAASGGESAAGVEGRKGVEPSASLGRTESDAVTPYAETRYFSDQKEQLEAENVIPPMEDHPIFTCAAHYREDGSLYSVVFQWHREGEQYSNLELTVAAQPVEEPSDCILVEVDENGQPVETKSTITKRDGIDITTEGKEGQEKTMTFQNDNGWYRLTASWNDSFSDLEALLDWVWTHPIDAKSRFPMEAGDIYRSCTLAEKPDAFSDYLPDFAGYGFIEEESSLSLKNDTPVRFEGHYVAHADKALVEKQEYYSTEGYTLMHWCFETEPTVYDLQRSAGELKDLTKKQVLQILKEESSITFTWDGFCTTVFPQDAGEAWTLIQSLQDRLD